MCADCVGSTDALENVRVAAREVEGVQTSSAVSPGAQATRDVMLEAIVDRLFEELVGLRAPVWGIDRVPDGAD